MWKEESPYSTQQAHPAAGWCFSEIRITGDLPSPRHLRSRGTALHLLLSTGVQIATPPPPCKMLFPYPVQGCGVAGARQSPSCLEAGIPRKADPVQQKLLVCPVRCPGGPQTHQTRSHTSSPAHSVSLAKTLFSTRHPPARPHRRLPAPRKRGRSGKEVEVGRRGDAQSGGSEERQAGERGGDVG